MVYSCEVDTGNYTGTSLQDAMSAKLATVKRQALSGDFHTLDVSVDTRTDIAEFTSLILGSLPNPVSVVSNSSRVTVLFPGHTFAQGGRAFLSGIIKTIGGVSQGF